MGLGVVLPAKIDHLLQEKSLQPNDLVCSVVNIQTIAMSLAVDLFAHIVGTFHDQPSDLFPMAGVKINVAIEPLFERHIIY